MAGLKPADESDLVIAFRSILVEHDMDAVNDEKRNFKSKDRQLRMSEVEMSARERRDVEFSPRDDERLAFSRF